VPGCSDTLYPGGSHPAARPGLLDLRAARPDSALKESVAADEEAAAIRRLVTLLGSPAAPAAVPDQALPASFARIVITPGGPKPARVRLSHAGPICRGDLTALLAHPRWGVTEQVAGRRCVIVGEEDGTLRAYDRCGDAVPVPVAAQALARLGGSFIIDGAAPTHDPTGAYVAFDYLARHGASLRALPYEERSTRLAATFFEAGLIPQAGATLARLVPTAPGLGLLIPAVTAATKTAVLAAVATAGGAGIVLRHLDGPSLPGDTRHDLIWPLSGGLDFPLPAPQAWIGAY
jgi:hypothetical protein